MPKPRPPPVQLPSQKLIKLDRHANALDTAKMDLFADIQEIVNENQTLTARCARLEQALDQAIAMYGTEKKLTREELLGEAPISIRLSKHR